MKTATLKRIRTYSLIGGILLCNPLLLIIHLVFNRKYKKSLKKGSYYLTSDENGVIFKTT